MFPKPKRKWIPTTRLDWATAGWVQNVCWLGTKRPLVKYETSANRLSDCETAMFLLLIIVFVKSLQLTRYQTILLSNL